MDITKTESFGCVERVLQKCHGLRFAFIEGDDLVVPTMKADLIFIDTWHTYAQLTKELERWADAAGRYLVFHDTQSFGYHDEGVAGHGGKNVDEALYVGAASKVGLRAAVTDFMSTHPEWIIEKEFINNSGLLILARK